MSSAEIETGTFKKLKRKSTKDEYKFTNLFIETIMDGNRVDHSSGKLYVYTDWQWYVLTKQNRAVEINLDLVIFSLGPPDGVVENRETNSSSGNCCVVL